jgi:small subunit ribosomal protein S6
VNEYEVLLMLDPDAPEGRHDEILARTRELVEKDGGAWDGHEPWGRRRLAYEIDKKGEGVYHLVTFKCEPATLDEVSRVLKITDGVMRHMPTRRPKPHRRAATTRPPAQRDRRVEEKAGPPDEEGGA